MGAPVPDALAAGPLVARVDGVLLLVPRGSLADSPPTAAFVDEQASGIAYSMVVGGPAAISDDAADELRVALE
jgi:hypothetical protein